MSPCVYVCCHHLTGERWGNQSGKYCTFANLFRQVFFNFSPSLWCETPPGRCIFVSDSLWWDSVLGQKMEEFLASDKSEVTIGLLVSLQKANGESLNFFLSVLILWNILTVHESKPFRNRYNIIMTYIKVLITAKWEENCFLKADFDV